MSSSYIDWLTAFKSCHRAVDFNEIQSINKNDLDGINGLKSSLVHL